MRLELPAVPETAGEVRRAVSDFARVHGAINGTVADIALAVSEAVNNVILHAYRDRDSPGALTVVAERLGAVLQIAICDDGLGVTPRADSPGLGLGLSIIARLAQAVEIHERAEGGGELLMRFQLTA